MVTRVLPPPPPVWMRNLVGFWNRPLAPRPPITPGGPDAGYVKTGLDPQHLPQGDRPGSGVTPVLPIPSVDFGNGQGPVVQVTPGGSLISPPSGVGGDTPGVDLPGVKPVSSDLSTLAGLGQGAGGGSGGGSGGGGVTVSGGSGGNGPSMVLVVLVLGLFGFFLLRR